MIKINFLRFLVGSLFFAFCMQTIPAHAFMYVHRGDELPHLDFWEVSTDLKKEFGKKSGPLVLIFWGADIDTKRDRAIEVLSDIQNNRSFYKERGVELAAVFVQPQLMSLIDKVVSKTKIDFPVYVDNDRQAFENLGVYVMPSILIVTKDGIIHEGLGYTRNLDELLPGEIQVMLHEKDREELNAELHPEIVVRTTAQRRARLDYNYAMNLVKRHRVDAALDKLELSLQKNPDFLPAIFHPSR